MAGENEPAKLLLPYLQRADELQKHEPLVAYYCRLYAMERGLKIPQRERTKTTNALLVSLMKQLEKDKKSIKLGPEDNLYIEGFASNVFAKADKQDRAGRADLNTAKTFYAASIFFEILNQFGELQPDLEQKQKYAAWKAADIRKALKEGRKPIAGPPDGDKDLSIPSSMPNATQDLTRSNSDAFTSPRSDTSLSPQFPDNANNQHSTYIPSAFSYPSEDSRPPPPPISRTDSSTYSQAYHHEQYPQEPHQHLPQNYSSQPFPQESHQHMQQNYTSPPFPPESQQHVPQNYTPQSYPQEPQHLPKDYTFHTYPQEPQRHMPQDYPSRENSSNYSYPDVPSYPSFTESSSFPAAPAHYPAHHQGSETSYPSQPTPPPADYPSNSGRRNGLSPQLVAAHTPAPAPTYEYDSNYQPTPEKIAEAHKAARFAVGALAFDDVPVAVDFLRKSLELLTNPSAKH